MMAETINSDSNEELDYDDDHDDGEINSDSDLEDGEVRDNEEDAAVTTHVRQESQPHNANRQQNVCRFFPKGQCTWGNACRFAHVGRPMHVPLPPPPPFLPPPPPPPLPPPPPQRAAVEESSWERGLQRAKEAIQKATRRRETDEDFDEKRFNAQLTDDELMYERRRRLAYEHVPDNNNTAETFRDPWDRKRRKRSLSRSESEFSNSSEESDDARGGVDSWSDSLTDSDDSSSDSFYSDDDDDGEEIEDNNNENTEEKRRKPQKKTINKDDSQSQTAVSRREELLKQLATVESLIAAKKRKVSTQ